MGLGNFEDWEAEQQESNTGIFGDSIDMLQSGAIDTVAGVAEFAGAENLSDSLNDWSQEQFNTLSPEGKSAMSKQLINDDLSIGEGAKDPRTWWLNSMNVLGGMAVTMFPAGAAGKAASLAGQGSRIAANSGKVSVGVNALLNGAAGNGISARGVQDDINNLSFDDLKDSPRFKNIAQTHISNGDQPLEAMTKAREELAIAAGDELSGDFSLFALNSVLDGVGDKGFSKLIKGSLGKTVKGALAKGVASEAGTEAAQGYGETVLTNQAREEQTNEGRDLTEGAAANALTGAALGAVIGGVPAPIGAQVGKVRRRNFESKIESVVNPETVTKMRSQGYNDTDIRRVLSEGVSNQALGLGFEPSEAKQLSDQAIDFALGNTPSANQRHAVEDEAAQGQPNEQPQQQNATQAQESAPLTWSEENGYPDPSEFGLSEQDAELIIDPPPELLSAQGTINPKAPKALKQAYQIAMGRAESSEYHKAVFNNSAPEREQSQQAWNQEAQQNLNWQQQQNPETVEQDQNALAESIRAGDLSFVDNAARNDQQFANGLRTAMDISPSAVLQIAQMRRSGEMNENQALSALQRVINSVNNFDDSLDATPEELDLRTRSNQQRAQQDFENMPDEQRRQEIQARLLQGRQEQQQTNSAQGQERPNGERDVTPVNTGIENQRVDNAPRVEFDRWSDVVSGDQDIDQRDYNSPFGDYREAQVMEQDTIHQPRETAERQPSPEPTTQDQVDQFRGQSAGVLQGNLSGVNPKANQRSQKKQGKKVAEGKRAIAARLNAQQEANAPQDHSTEYQPNNALADAFESAKQPEPQPEPEPEVKPESKAPKAKTTQTKIGDGVDGTETKDGKAWRYSREGVRTQVSVTVQSDRGFVELISGGVRKRFYYGKKGADKGVSSESLINNEIQAGSFDNAKKLANKAINQQLDTNATAQAKSEETLAEVKATSRDKAAGGRLAELQEEREVIAAAVKAHEDMEERDAVEDKDPTLAQKKAILAGVDTFGAASKAYGGMDGLFRAGRPLKLRLASLDTEIGKLQDTEEQSPQVSDAELQGIKDEQADAKKGFKAAADDNNQLGMDRSTARLKRLNKIQDGKGTTGDLKWLRSELAEAAKGVTTPEKAEVQKPIAKERFKDAKTGKSANPRMQAWLDTLDQSELDQINDNADYMAWIGKLHTDFSSETGKSPTNDSADFDKYIRSYADSNLSDRVAEQRGPNKKTLSDKSNSVPAVIEKPTVNDNSNPTKTELNDLINWKQSTIDNYEARIANGEDPRGMNGVIARNKSDISKLKARLVKRNSVIDKPMTKIMSNAVKRKLGKISKAEEKLSKAEENQSKVEALHSTDRSGADKSNPKVKAANNRVATAQKSVDDAIGELGDLYNRFLDDQSGNKKEWDQLIEAEKGHLEEFDTQMMDEDYRPQKDESEPTKSYDQIRDDLGKAKTEIEFDEVYADNQAALKAGTITEARHNEIDNGRILRMKAEGLAGLQRASVLKHLAKTNYQKMVDMVGVPNGTDDAKYLVAMNDLRANLINMEVSPTDVDEIIKGLNSKHISSRQVALKKVAELLGEGPEPTPPKKKAPTKKAETKAKGLSDFSGAVAAVNPAVKGELSFDEYKAVLASLVASESDIKAALYDSPVVKRKRKEDVKDSLVKQNFNRLVYGMLQAISPNYGSYEGLDVFSKRSTLEQLEDRVSALTEETYNTNVANRKEQRAKSESDEKARKAGIENPETRADFMRLASSKDVSLNNIATILDDEQLAQFDTLAAQAFAEKQENQFQRELERRGTIQAVEGTDSVGHETEMSTFDSGSPSYVVRLTDRIGKEKWKELAQAARKIDSGVKVANARYAKSVGKPEGWHFTSPEAQNQFVALLRGEEVNATENLTAQAEKKANSAKEKQVNKLKSLSESQDAKAEEVINQDRKTNTAKRAGDAARVLERAYGQQENARILGKIAEGVESGDISVLGNLQDLTQLETLEYLTRRLLWNMSESDRDKFAKRDSMGRWFLNSDVTIDQIVRFARFPDPEMHVNNLNGLARDMAVVKGYLNTGKFIAKQVENHSGDNLITMTGPVWNKHIAKIRAFAKIKNYGAADLANELFKTEGRLNRMGIVDNATLREALRELDAVSKEITTSKPKETPVSRLTDAIEQKVRASNKAYIDFFPTDNNELAENVIDSADIQEGMKVLEPSAGMGDLADRIAAKGADLDVGDISSDMRELLEAKGHNVIGDNFLEMESAPIYDRIVMNPPFHNDSAITHINHALSMLKDGGRLVAITPINTGDKGNSKNKNFREYLDAVGAVEENNPSGSFKNSLNSTGVETKTIVIDKPENSADLPPPDDIRFSQTSVGADTKSAGVTVRKVMNEADKFISGYEGMKGINVTVVETQDQLSDFTATEPNTKVKGVWLSGDNRVVLVAENLANAQEVRSVLRHELIAHNGLYANLSPKEIETLTKKINALRGNAKVKPLFDEVDKAYKGAPDEVKAEEVIARLAEKESGKLKQIADRVLAFVMGALRRSGVLSQDKATLAEIRTMINNTDNYLRDNKGQLRSPGVIRFSQTIAKEDAEQVDYGDPKMSYAEAVEIQADTFLKQILGKVPSKLKSTALYDAMKGNGWGLLTLRQLAEVAKAKVSPNYSNLLDQYVTTVNTKMARQNALLEDVTDLSEDIRQWIRKGNKDKADELFTFMHESTLENVDPSREYQDLTDLLTDMIGIKEQQIKGRSGESNKQLFDELKQYKKDLKGEMYRRKAHAKMKVIYDRMTDEQKDLFGRVRDHYEKQQDDMFTALVDRAAKLSLTGTGSSSSKQALNIHARLIKEFGKTHAAELGKLGSSEIALELAIAKKGYYVPLARFGKYWVSTKWEAGSKKPNGEVELDSQFEMFESEEEMNARVKQLTAAGFKPKFGKNIEESGMVSGATMSFVTDVMDKINEAKAQNEVKDQLKDDLYQMFLQALPDRSIRKSFIHRKGTKGYSDNALRALADQGFKQSRQQARLETEDDLQAILTGVNDMAKSETNNVSAQRIADEMNKRHEWVMNPKRAKWAQKLTGIGFFMLIGASPASALMNITQNIQVAIPVIGSKYGYAATASEMGKLTKLWVTNRYAASKDQKTKNRFGVLGSILEGDEREAMRRAVEQGTIDVTQTSDALGLAEEPDAQIGDWKDRVNRTLGWSFHNAEVLNREVTFMTAYRLAKRDGLGNEAAYHYATKATWDSHFDYGSLNRARFMQGDVATVAMQFKQYSQNMSYYLIHNTLKALGKGNPTPEQKAEARKQIMGTMALTFAMGGLSAMPLATLAAIANMVHSAISDEYDPWDAETELNGILTEWFGAEWAKTLYNGLPPEVGLPSIGSRINIDFMGMWVRQSDAENASGTVADIGEQFFGPIGGIITNGARGFDYMGQGRLYRGTEMFMPKWIKDIVKTARYSAEGGNVTNRNGEVMVGDLTGVEYAGQLLGFTPTRLSEQYDTNSRIKKYENKIKMHRKILMNQMWVSYMKKDQEEIRNIWKSIKEYNRSDWGKVNPITSDAVKTSLQGHLRMQQKAVNGLHYNPKFEQLVRNKFLQE
ncbi:PLxRFG domain-containing protein [Vibrio splendidus]|uniref:PLxRFG domain-containing protein n=1 Tax=Vibrio splendidus TaxID=29497 RepID=UPI00076A8990|nr:PLxRFG domain-containing protein [Vibrio splendidus]PHX05519.1 DNA primase TraC [Vibrio splendidus]